jgi:hypothetical protein
MLLGKLAPIRTDLPDLCGGLDFRIACIRAYIRHVNFQFRLKERNRGG